MTSAPSRLASTLAASAAVAAAMAHPAARLTGQEACSAVLPQASAKPLSAASPTSVPVAACAANKLP